MSSFDLVYLRHDLSLTEANFYLKNGHNVSHVDVCEMAVKVGTDNVNCSQVHIPNLAQLVATQVSNTCVMSS